MSSIGKIFVVLNLVLSLLVVGAAGSLLRQTEVTKADIAAKDKELAAANTALEDANSGFSVRERELTESKQRLQEEKDDLDVARLNLENTNKRIEADNQQLRDDVTKITASIEALQTSYTSTLQRSQELSDKNEELRNESIAAKEAERQAELAKRDLTDQITAANTKATDLEGQFTTAQDEIKGLQAQLAVAAASGFDSAAIMAMPQIDATVAEVDPTYGFVILDKGSRDDVKKGFTFEVYRGGTYLGRVKVDEVYNDYSTARIEIKAPDVAMQRFDKASTHLN